MGGINMIDGIKLYYQIEDYQEWKKTVNIDLFNLTDKYSGEIKESHRVIKGQIHSTIKYTGKFETYLVSVKETVRHNLNGNNTTSYFMEISGSLHKNYCGGENYSQFNLNELQVELTKIEEGLNIPFDLVNLVNIEVGVNLVTPFEVTPFLRNSLLSYKGNSFNDYFPDRNGFVLGKYCKLSQYTIKIYDKGKQYDLPYNLMRYELRFTKMAIVKKEGVKNLNSLKNSKIVCDLISLLINSWNNVLIYDNSIVIGDRRITPKHRKMLIKGNNPKYWEQLKENNKRAFNYQRTVYKQLVKKYGVDLHSQVKELIKREWDILINNCTKLPVISRDNMYEFTEC
jgi:hypothetical protein